MKDSRDYDRVPFHDAGLPFYIIMRKSLDGFGDQLTRPKWHEQLEIKYILSGRAEITCGSQVFEAVKGDIAVINPCELHSIRSVGPETVSYHLVMIQPDLHLPPELQRRLLPVAEGRLRFSHLIRGDAEAERLLLGMVSASAAGQDLMAYACLIGLSAHLLEHRTDPDSISAYPDSVRRYAERIQPALCLIGTGYARELSLDEMAASCSMSVYHFCRMFKSVTGQTAVAYLTRYRISKAALLLRSTDLPVSDVASAIGMEDSRYFSRCFKKLIGINPSRYRKEQREKTEQDNPT